MNTFCVCKSLQTEFCRLHDTAKTGYIVESTQPSFISWQPGNDNLNVCKNHLIKANLGVVGPNRHLSTRHFSCFCGSRIVPKTVTYVKSWAHVLVTLELQLIYELWARKYGWKQRQIQLSLAIYGLVWVPEISCVQVPVRKFRALALNLSYLLLSIVSGLCTMQSTL